MHPPPPFSFHYNVSIFCMLDEKWLLEGPRIIIMSTFKHTFFCKMPSRSPLYGPANVYKNARSEPAIDSAHFAERWKKKRSWVTQRIEPFRVACTPRVKCHHCPIEFFSFSHIFSLLLLLLLVPFLPQFSSFPSFAK